MIRNILLSTLLLSCLGLIGQKSKNASDEPDDENMKKYLDDGNISFKKNLVRIRAASTVAGYYGLSYERKVWRNIGVEGGFYVRLAATSFLDNFRVVNMLLDEEPEIMIDEVSSGTQLTIYPKIYFSGKPNRINAGYFVGLRSNFRNYTADLTMKSQFNDKFQQKDVKCASTSYILTTGAHQKLAGPFVIGCEAGFGFGSDKLHDLDKITYGSNVNSYTIEHTTGVTKKFRSYFSLDLAIGYLF